MQAKWQESREPSGQRFRHRPVQTARFHSFRCSSRRPNNSCFNLYNTFRINFALSSFSAHPTFEFGEFFTLSSSFYSPDNYTMADSSAVREENPDLFPKEGKGWDDYEHQKNLKSGAERLDRRSKHPDKNEVKKHGHGGKFTVDGPYTDQDYTDPIPAAMDEKDPNYVDPAEEQADKDAGIPVVEVAKLAPTGAGSAHSAS